MRTATFSASTLGSSKRALSLRLTDDERQPPLDLTTWCRVVGEPLTPEAARALALDVDAELLTAVSVGQARSRFEALRARLVGSTLAVGGRLLEIESPTAIDLIGELGQPRALDGPLRATPERPASS